MAGLVRSLQSDGTATPKAAEELKAVSQCGRILAEILAGRIAYQTPSRPLSQPYRRTGKAASKTAGRTLVTLASMWSHVDGRLRV